MSEFQRKKLNKLRVDGKVENEDFRVVWFGTQAEIKIINKKEKV